MTILLPDVIFDTARSTYSPSTGTTAKPLPYLTNIAARMYPTTATQLSALPQEALMAQYTAEVESGIDIVTGDLLTRIVRASDNATPWPNDFPVAPTSATPASVTWRVVHVAEQHALLLPRRMVFVARVISGGPLGTV